MQDHPTVKELLMGIYEFLQTDIVPALEDPQRFHVRVAANLLKIIEREIQLESDLVAEEGSRLRRLLDKGSSADTPDNTTYQISKLNEELCELIRAGEADQGPWRTDVLNHVRQTLIEKLKIANPGMIDRAQNLF